MALGEKLNRNYFVVLDEMYKNVYIQILPNGNIEGSETYFSTIYRKYRTEVHLRVERIEIKPRRGY